jgi:hypothetical protein
MINLIDLSRRFENQWIVLDHSHTVIDHGPELQTLQVKHEGNRRTFYFVSKMP